MEKVNKNLLLIYTISFASFMVNFDTYVVNVALPDILKDFNTNTSNISWIITGYNLMVVSLLLVFGKLGDKIGIKKLFNIGFLIFTISSFLCGISFNMLMLTISRMLQGIGASVLYALPQAMIAKYIPQDKKRMAFGILASVAALGITLAAPLSGFISAYLSWRWIFFINIPIGILSVLFLNYSMNGIFDKTVPFKNFDYSGAVLSFFLAFLITLYLNRGNSIGWSSPLGLGLLFVILIIFGRFIITESDNKYPLINLNVFKDFKFVSANTAMFLISAYLAAGNFLIPFWLSEVKSYSEVQIGLIFMVYSVSYLIMSVVSGKLSNKISLNFVCSLACLLAVLNTLGFVYFMDSLKYYVLVFFMLNGTAFSFFITSNNNLVMQMAKKGEEGIIAGIHRLTGRLGMLWGVAVFEAFYTLNLKLGINSAFKKAYLFGALICFIAMIFSFINKNVPDEIRTHDL
ncbi:MFS transporter [bacterium]|nr:MFS transporter [bacterium]